VRWRRFTGAQNGAVNCKERIALGCLRGGGMLRFMPKLSVSFAPDASHQLEVLAGRLQWRGRASVHQLTPALQGNDPLPDPFPDPDLPAEPEKREPKLPTPTDVPVPQPTDVPVPEPWDVPPPDPTDPRPKSIP
jgi:hypothetical protein